MRPRFTLLVGAVVTLAAAMPGVVSAAPRRDHGLTIAATPDPIIAGEAVLIYGQLNGADNAGQTIRLYHHLAGSQRGYTLVTSTTTDSTGFYEFPRAEDVVYTNRNWFVRGPDGTHSRTVRERVAALVNLQASTTSAFTDHPVLFTGAVIPNHAGESVSLQQQIGSGDRWRTLEHGRLGPMSKFAISYAWKRPGVHDVRVLFAGDARNVAGASDPVTVNIQQAQVPDFTIASSEPIAPEGSTVTISGTLYNPGTTTPEPDTPVQLWGRSNSERRFTVLGNTTTDNQGDYAFIQANQTRNTEYYVSTLPAPPVKARHTARLDQGVQDALTMQASPTNTVVGQVVSFTGTVMPDKAGHPIYLERLGRDGDWHVVGVQEVRRNSTYLFTRKFGDAGTFEFRTRITSDGRNVGSHSPPATITVTLPPPSSLPPAS